MIEGKIKSGQWFVWDDSVYVLHFKGNRGILVNLNRGTHAGPGDKVSLVYDISDAELFSICGGSRDLRRCLRRYRPSDAHLLTDKLNEGEVEMRVIEVGDEGYLHGTRFSFRIRSDGHISIVDHDHGETHVVVLQTGLNVRYDDKSPCDIVVQTDTNGAFFAQSSAFRLLEKTVTVKVPESKLKEVKAFIDGALKE